MKKIISVIIAACAFLLGCNGTKTKDMRFEGNWTLVSFMIGKENVLEKALLHLENEVTMNTVDAGENGFRTGGYSGVNSFMGGAKAYTDGSVKIEFNASTKMAGVPEAEKFEDDFRSAVEKCKRITFDGNKMIIFGSDVLLTFVRTE